MLRVQRIEFFGQIGSICGGQFGQFKAGSCLIFVCTAAFDEQLGHFVGADLVELVSKGMPCDFTGTSWEKLENSHGVQWPFREGEVLEEDERRLYEDGNYFTPSKKAKFIFEEIRENPLPLTDEFPILLNTGRGTVGQWHTQTRTREVQFVEDVVADKAYVYMNTILASGNARIFLNWMGHIF